MAEGVSKDAERSTKAPIKKSLGAPALSFGARPPGHDRQCSALMAVRDSQAPLGRRAFMLERGEGQGGLH